MLTHTRACYDCHGCEQVSPTAGNNEWSIDTRGGRGSSNSPPVKPMKISPSLPDEGGIKISTSTARQTICMTGVVAPDTATENVAAQISAAADNELARERDRLGRRYTARKGALSEALQQLLDNMMSRAVVAATQREVSALASAFVGIPEHQNMAASSEAKVQVAFAEGFGKVELCDMKDATRGLFVVLLTKVYVAIDASIAQQTLSSATATTRTRKAVAAAHYTVKSDASTVVAKDRMVVADYAISTKENIEAGRYSEAIASYIHAGYTALSIGVSTGYGNGTDVSDGAPVESAANFETHDLIDGGDGITFVMETKTRSKIDQLYEYSSAGSDTAAGVKLPAKHRSKFLDTVSNSSYMLNFSLLALKVVYQPLLSIGN